MITKAQLQGGDPFKFWMPFETIEKAKGKNGKTKMVVKGVASTDDEDADGENLLPKGFELDHLMKYGFINWHHQSKKSPKAIIGEPTSAKIINKGKSLYVEAELYDTDLGKAVYEFADTLSKSGSKRKLGWSIEGKALERDPKNEKRVLKAAITDIAITPAPKNSKTFVDIAKGHFSNEDWEFEIDDKDNLIDVVRPNGDHLTISKSFEINISKAQDTVNTDALIKEDLEGAEKNQEYSGSNSKSKKNLNKKTKKGMEHTKEQIAKAAESLGMSEDELTKSLTSDLSLEKASDKMKKTKKDEDEDEYEKEDDTEKGIDAQILAKQKEIDELKKSKSSGDNDLAKAISEQTATLADFFKKSNETSEELSKGIEDINEKFSEMEERLETVENQPVGRKSVTAKPLSKAFGGEEEGSGNRLSITQNKADILNFLEVKSGLTKGEITDEAYANAMGKFESTGQLDKDIAMRLQVEDNITFLP